ncbi:uncharacterized protein PITG_13118 [Phytophthora infestans T30-4]|uniref:Uncharacterized protein n=1 Tax=Phytophthora infestans (strain T30-4) TaxID=403677 RepID=D0NJM2_PHYIT|nr:uncharacterized protein PITG_13118 [Phytophthora infestans T30-4]EEY59958.1 conserved hypothetical protein [Phytophthora infestans T30-4]|eukprot:XP_002900643.1 conserved hypothetical protein [Phytophthora infestans T30-4]
MEWEAPIPAWIESISIDMDEEMPDLSSKPVAKPKAKPGRRPRHKVDVDPSGSNQRRKDKQRGYEKDYRIRMKKKRLQDEAEWIRLETQIRNMLTKRTSVRYLQLLQEERALREAEVLDSCFLADIQALLLWGGTTAPSREVREQLNSLPSLRRCHTFEFSW